MNNLSRIRALILIIILTLISFLLIRFIVEFSKSDLTNAVVTLLLFPTGFISAFYSTITIGSIEISTVFAIITLIIFAYISSKIITSLERSDEDSTFLEIIEAVLRAFEFLIVLRLILKFIGANGLLSLFTGLIYFLTDWSGFIIRPLDLTFGIFDISALIMLVILIFLDINTEVILRGVKFIKAGSAKSVDFISSTTQKVGTIAVRKKDESTIEPVSEDINDVLKPTVYISPETLEEIKPEDNIEEDSRENIPDEAGGFVEVKTPEKSVKINLPTSENGEKPPAQIIKIEGDDIEVETQDPHTIHKDDKTAPEG